MVGEASFCDWRLGRSSHGCTAALAVALALVTAFGDAQARQPQAIEETATRQVGEPIMAIVSIATQQITMYDASGWTHRAPISSGMRGHETPAGIFAVVQKNADHRSNLYDDAWMPHMQRLTWNGVALHGGALPGHPASRGCVRMPFGFAEKLFDRTRIGMRVIVSPRDTTPVAFTHPVLLSVRADRVPAALAAADALDREAAEAAKVELEARKTAAAAFRGAALLRASIRRQEGLKTRAESELAQAALQVEAATTDQGRASAEAAKLKAAAKVAETAAQIEAASADLTPKLNATAEGSAAVKDAAARTAHAAKAAKDARLALEPTSVYVSRATQMLYVRRNTRKPIADGGEVFDSSIEVPIAIRDPEKRIGTHIFTAMASGDSGLRWSAVTIDAGSGARDALDRVTIPQEILDLISSTAVPRTSIIVSDEPLSRETNYRTEFVVVLSDQPQGGFITRRPTVARSAESTSPWQRGW